MKSSLLLDTSVFLWMAVDDPRLGKACKILIDGARLQLSAVSVIEINVKAQSGKLRLDTDINSLLNSLQIEVLPLSREHALAHIVNPKNKDPFDNTICGVAVVEQLSLLTSDVKVLNYKLDGLKTIDARN